MRIQHNEAATTAYMYQTEQQRHMSKTMQKLASGFRINRAADDAAGLAISEKMRVQIGAYMNRLEHTIEQVATSAENVTAAESRIRRYGYGEGNDAVDEATTVHAVEHGNDEPSKSTSKHGFATTIKGATRMCVLLFVRTCRPC